MASSINYSAWVSSNISYLLVLRELALQACGPISSFKRLITPANKPQGFGFADFQDPDGALRAMSLLNGVELPALEDGCVNKKLLVSCFNFSTRCVLISVLGQSGREDQDIPRCLCNAENEN